jgi:hypothetical protein
VTAECVAVAVAVAHSASSVDDFQCRGNPVTAVRASLLFELTFAPT